MAKVILNKSTKIKGMGLVRAGIEIEVTADQKKQLEKGGFLGKTAKSNVPSNEKEIKELVAKVAALETQIEDGGDNSALTDEIEALKSDVKSRDDTIEILTGEIEALKADLTEAKKK